MTDYTRRLSQGAFKKKKKNFSFLFFSFLFFTTGSARGFNWMEASFRLLPFAFARV